MKRVIGAAAMLLAGAVAPARAADLYEGRVYGGGYHEAGRHGGHHGRAVRFTPEDGVYGRPRFFRGRALVEVEPGLTVEVREPYIGRGLVYNVPPDLYGRRHRYGGVVSARY